MPIFLKQDEWGRRISLLAYWGLFVIGTVLWYWTTSITRYPLPVSLINSLSSDDRQREAEDSIRVRGYPGYQISFTLVTPSGETVDLLPSYREHFEPGLAGLSELAFFKVDFQTRLHADTTAPLQRSGRGGGVVLSEEAAKSFVNGAQWSLASSISSLPILNFVIYLPDPANRPVFIGSTATSFVLPQWGGVCILNGPPAGDRSQVDRAMQTFWGHLEELLGLGPDLFREKTGRCREHAIHSLKALVKIVEANPNMVVPLEVSDSVNRACRLLVDLDSTLSSAAADEQRQFGMARTAQDLAEYAFFHPAMTARQYFPQEHVLAVYIPLFVPFLMPLFVQTARHLKSG